MSASDQPQYQCARCQWFDLRASQYGNHGYCRKNPPAMAIGQSIEGYWPMILNPDANWCGQFSPKRHAPWTATTTEGATK